MNIKLLLVLIVAYFIYMILGAVAFMLMERPFEKKRCKEAQDAKASWLEQIVKNEGFTPAQLNGFIENVTRFAGYGISLSGKVKCPNNWNFQSSFFFSGTIITTIGYGNLAPTLWYSQLFCIFYAIFGIPLFAIMFSGIGHYLSKVAEKLLDHCSRVQNEDLKFLDTSVKFSFIAGGSLVFFHLIPAIIFTYVEGWTYRESVYYCFITLTTIGFGDFVAGTNPDVNYIAVYRIMVLFWIFFGLAYTFTAIDIIVSTIRNTVLNSKTINRGLERLDEAEEAVLSEIESLLSVGTSDDETPAESGDRAVPLPPDTNPVPPTSND